MRVYWTMATYLSKKAFHIRTRLQPGQLLWWCRAAQSAELHAAAAAASAAQEATDRSVGGYC